MQRLQTSFLFLLRFYVSILLFLFQRFFLHLCLGLRAVKCYTSPRWADGLFSPPHGTRRTDLISIRSFREFSTVHSAFRFIVSIVSPVTAAVNYATGRLHSSSGRVKTLHRIVSPVYSSTEVRNRSSNSAFVYVSALCKTERFGSTLIFTSVPHWILIDFHSPNLVFDFFISRNGRRARRQSIDAG